MTYQLRLRRGTAAQWAAKNPVLSDGEEGYERDTRKRKVGDGTTAWNSLPYVADGVTINEVQTAVSDALAALPADAITNASQVETIVQTALASFASNGLTDEESDLLDSIAAAQVKAWELQPGSDVMATTIDGLSPVAITDENAGGVIGDIAYVVSGYVYNRYLTQAEMLAKVQGLPQFKGEFAVPGTYATGDIVVENGNVQIFSRGGTYDADGATSSAVRDSYLDGTVAGKATNEASYWPYLERYNLKTKAWLSRIKLPEIMEDFVYSNTPPHSFDSRWTAGPFDLNSGTLSSHSVDDRYLMLPGGGETIAYVPAGGASVEFPAGTYIVRTSNFGLPDDSVDNAEALGDSLGTRITGTRSLSIGNYSAEGGFAGVINGKLYFGGGDGDNITGTEFFVYDPATEEFERLPDNENGWGDYNPFGVVGGKLYVMDHLVVSGGGVSDIENYDPATGLWTTQSFETADGDWADQVQGVEIDGKLYFVYDRVYVLDPVALTVEAKAALPQELNAPMAIWSDDTSVFCMGQKHGDNTIALAYRYSVANDVWNAYETVDPLITSYAVTATASGIPFVMGGAYSITGSHSTPLLGVYGLTGARLNTDLLGGKPASRFANLGDDGQLLSVQMPAKRVSDTKAVWVYDSIPITHGTNDALYFTTSRQVTQGSDPAGALGGSAKDLPIEFGSGGWLTFLETDRIYDVVVDATFNTDVVDIGKTVGFTASSSFGSGGGNAIIGRYAQINIHANFAIFIPLNAALPALLTTYEASELTVDAEINLAISITQR